MENLRIGPGLRKQVKDPEILNWSQPLHISLEEAHKALIPSQAPIKTEWIASGTGLEDKEVYRWVLIPNNPKNL